MDRQHGRGRAGPRLARPQPRRDARDTSGRGKPASLSPRRRARRAGPLVRGAIDRDRGPAGTIAHQMRRHLGLVIAALVLSACNQTAATPLTASTASSARVLVAAPDLGDQPSFSNRTGQLPVLSLQSMFHPSYTVPGDPSRIRTLLVTGDVIPARGVNYFATTRRDFLWPFRRTADYTKNPDITYLNLEAPLFPDCPLH